MKAIFLPLLLASTCASLAQTVIGFESPADFTTTRLSMRSARLTPTTINVTQGSQACQAVFAASTAQGWVRVKMAPTDFNALGGFAVDIQNQEARTIDVGFTCRDVNGKAKTVWGTMAAGETATVVLQTNVAMVLPGTHEMIYLPNPYPGTRSVRFLSWPLMMSQITEIGIMVPARTQPITLSIDNIRLMPFVDMRAYTSNIVDRYGQWTGGTWPGKIGSDADLLADKAFEEAWWAREGAVGRTDRGPYLGWASGPQREATGFFRTEFIKGKWWLITPDGQLFFSVGPTSARRDAVESRVQGREYKFSWLPGATDPLAEHVYVDGKLGRVVNFHTMNLERKYGNAWKFWWGRWLTRRIPAWGFNTLAYGLDSYVYGSGVPYVEAIMTTLGPGKFIYPGFNYTGMPDPFDPAYPGWVRKQIEYDLPKVKDDPYLIGWFIDNEFPWANRSVRSDITKLGRDIMNRHATLIPAKRELVNFLRGKYGTIAALNEAWGWTYTSWASVEAANVIPFPTPPKIQPDLRTFIGMFADKMFSIHRAELKALDPNHLYLGSRFDVWTPEVLEAAARHQDVVSFNSYTMDVTKPSFRYPEGHDFWNRIGKPVIIGEFHFPAFDRGFWGFGIAPGPTMEGMSPLLVPGQAGRAQWYINYMESVFTHPSIVGAHWHRYADDPVSGRAGSGFNSNIGFVSVADQPYYDMLLPMRDYNMNMYTRRLSK